MTSVDEIVRRVGVAKGTFYYYFKSKEEVLSALASEMVARMGELSRAVSEDPNMGAIEKICVIIHGQKKIQMSEQGVIDDLHRPENRELHERSNVETVLIFGPILAGVIEQGQREGVFNLDDPLSTVQFILAGSLFLFGEGVFSWTPEEEIARNRAMLTLIERALGAPVGSFNPIMLDLLQK